MIAVPSPPSSQELNELPLREVVCFAVRILKRLEPELYQLRDEPTCIGIAELLAIADSYCRGDKIDRGCLVRALNQTQFGQQPISSVAYFAGSMGWGISKDDPSIVTRGLFGLSRSVACMWSEMARDFEQLRKMRIRNAATAAIDPSESGPMGPLWDGSPSRSFPQSVWENIATKRRRDQAMWSAIIAARSPELLIQAAIVTFGDNTSEGQLVIDVAMPWMDIMREIERDPDFLYQFVKSPRKFEEFIAATYKKAGWPEVTLTPRSKDGGRDVIAVKPGHGSIRFLEQCKAYKRGHLVTHDDVRAMLGVLQTDPNASKGIITTTSDFQPGIFTGADFKPFMPHRLELKNGQQLRDWLLEFRDDD